MNQFQNHPNGRLAAAACIRAMIEDCNKRITRLQIGHTRRGSPDSAAVDCLKQDRDALVVALEAMEG